MQRERERERGRERERERERESERERETARWRRAGESCDTPNLPTNIVDFRGLDSSIILI